MFADAGTVFGTNQSSVANGVGDCTFVGKTGTVDCDVSDSAALRASIGAGLIWQSPFGPLRIEAAYPLLRQDFDETEWFRFSIGTRF